MKSPVWLLRLLPMWDYICPKCRKEVKKNSSKCPYCGERYGQPIRIPPKVLKDAKALEDYVHRHIFPKISKAQRDYLAQYFTELFSDGFESGDFSAWTGTSGSPSIVEDPVYQGSYAGECNGYYSAEYCREDLGNLDEVYSRFYFYMNTPPSGDSAYIFSLHNQDYSIAYYLRIYNDGGTLKLVLDWQTPALTDQEYSHSFQDSTWYCIESRYLKHSTDGGVQVWLGGNLVIDDLGHTLDKAARIMSVGVVSSSTNYDCTLDIDCVVVADTYIGPETTEQTYTKTWTTDALFKKLAISKALSVDTAFQKQDIPKTFGIDADFLKNDLIKSFTLDARFGALMTQTISRQVDILLKKLDATKNFGLDVYFGPFEAGTYAKTFGLDVIFAYKVRLPELWLDENGKFVLNLSKPYTWVGT